MTKKQIIGFYGLPGSGKTTLLQGLQATQFGISKLNCFEGSQVLNSVCSGGLEEFKLLSSHQRDEVRTEAIRTVSDRTFKRARFVTGHFSFLGEGSTMRFEPVFSIGDEQVYTMIVYHTVDPSELVKRVQDDKKSHRRDRPQLTETEWQTWQEWERRKVRQVCLECGILFFELCAGGIAGGGSATPQAVVDQVVHLLSSYLKVTSLNNAQSVMDSVGRACSRFPHLDLVPFENRSVLLLDGDKTCTRSDTAEFLFPFPEEDKVSTVFKMLGYSNTAFMQQHLMYEEWCMQNVFETKCQSAASQVELYPEMQALIQRVLDNGPFLSVLIVTAGCKRVWELVMHRFFPKHSRRGEIHVLGSTPISSHQGFYSSQGKGHVVTCLRQNHLVRTIFALGDSPLDIDMMRKATQSFVVMDTNSSSRSQSMPKVLEKHMPVFQSKCRRLNLGGTSSFVDLPLVDVGRVFQELLVHSPPRSIHLTGDAFSLLLASTTRSSVVFGPELQRAHKRVGFYLASILASLVGLEEVEFPHVQGNGNTTGFQLKDHSRTSVIALMRAGLSLAQGVHESFPRSSLLFVDDDVERDFDKEKNVVSLANATQIIICDAVINTGKTLSRVLTCAQTRFPTARVYCLSVVMHNDALSPNGPLAPFRNNGVVFLTLRTSSNQFKGVGTSDTGNRLFSSL